MFNLPSDPWYHYMQPFRIALLKKMIKVQQQQEQQKEKTSQEQLKKE